MTYQNFKDLTEKERRDLYKVYNDRYIKSVLGFVEMPLINVKITNKNK